MKIHLALAAAVTMCASAPSHVAAHHSFSAEFDASKPVTLKGTVNRIEWTNPHAHLLLDVTDEAGHVTTWKFELASPKVLVQQCGWRPTTVNIGDEISVEGAMAKDGTATGNARALTLPGGRRVSAGSSGGDVAPQRD
jgi:hypothetical protein